MDAPSIEAVLNQMITPVPADPTVRGSIEWQEFSQLERLAANRWRILSMDLGSHTYNPLWIYFELEEGSVLVHDNGLGQGEENSRDGQIQSFAGLLGGITPATFAAMVTQCTCDPAMQIQKDARGRYGTRVTSVGDISDAAFALTSHLAQCAHLTMINQGAAASQMGSQITFL